MTQSGPPDQVGVGGSELGGFDVSVPNPARMWNYWVGGKDNFAADRQAAEQVLEVMPSLPLIARLARRFLIDAVHRLAAGYGVRQFLDIGTGLPTADNTHDVAQQAAPQSQIVYVDNDPVVLAHARALLTGSPEGETDYIPADLRDTAAILSGAGRTLDFSQPVAVLLIAVLHFIPDADDPYAIVARLMDARAVRQLPGDRPCRPRHPDRAIAEMTRRYNELSPVPVTPRTGEQVARFFGGLEVIEPGVVPIRQWWAPQADTGADGGLAGYCGIGRKP